MRFHLLFVLLWCITELHGQEQQFIPNDSLTIDKDLFLEKDSTEEEPVKTTIWVEPKQIDAYFKCCENEDYKEQKACSQEELKNQVEEHITYPAVAKENGFQGRVYIEFEILETGEIGEVCILKGVHASIDREVVNAVRKITGYEPATVRGKPVKMKLVLPVSFSLR